MLRAALAELEREGVRVEAASPLIASAPLGPALRQYANGAALVVCDLEPPELLALLKSIENRFGRKASGQRWRARVLDLDILLWDGGAWSSPDLVVPHIALRDRHFVLKPATAIAALWRDPLSGLTLRQLLARLTRPTSPPSGRRRGEGP